MGTFNVIDSVKCCLWKVLPTVYSDALSYGEQLSKFCFTLNELVENNNQLPAYVKQMISEYISSGAIEEVVKDLLANYILNVKYPPNELTPATGDGTADDTQAIQGCIDYAYANGGMAVYFPSGAYSTQSLTLKDGVALVGFSRYNTKLVLRGGATSALISGNVSNIGITNLTLDANMGTQVNDISVIEVSASNMLISDCIMLDGYKLLSYAGVGGHLQLDNIVFGNCVNQAVNISGNSIVQMNSSVFTGLSAVSGVNVLEIGSDYGRYEFTSTAVAPVGLLINGNNNDIRATITNANVPVNDGGVGNNIDISSFTRREFRTGDVHENIGGLKSVFVDGNKTVNVKGMTNETYTNRTINHTGKYNESSGNKEVNVSGDYVENIDKNKEINVSQLIINTNNPISYGIEPTEYANYNNLFDSIPLTTPSGIKYDVLVGKKNTTSINDSYVNVDDFGAVGDGVTDDRNAFIMAIEVAEKTGATLTASNKSYFVSAGEIRLSCSVDLNYATVITEFNDRINTMIFRISSGGTSKSYAQAPFTKKAVTDQTLYGKSFRVTSPLKIGTAVSLDRFHNQLMVCGDNGEFENSEYYTAIINGNYELTNIQDSVRTNTFFKNANFVNNGIFDGGFIRCEKNNTTIENIKIKSNPSSVDAYSCIVVADCAYCEINNINGTEVYSTQPSYILALLRCSDITVNRLNTVNNSTGAWGAFESISCTNTTFKNSSTKRYDAHYEMMGKITVDNCILELVNLSMGWGELSISNCVINNIIQTRGDFCDAFSGIINVYNCVFNGDIGIRIHLLNYDTTNTEYTRTTINVNGCIFNCNLYNITLSAGAEYATNIYINCNNCYFTGSSYTPIASRGAYNIKRAVINQCCFYYEAQQGIAPELSKIDDYFLLNSYFASSVKFIGGSNIYVDGCIAYNLWSENFGALNSFRLTNCCVYTDNAFSETRASHMCVNNNLLLNDNKNQSSWNNILV